MKKSLYLIEQNLEENAISNAHFNLCHVIALILQERSKTFAHLLMINCKSLTFRDVLIHLHDRVNYNRHVRREKTNQQRIVTKF